MNGQLQQDIDLLLQQQQYSSAHKLLKSLIKKNKKDPELYRLIGIVFLHEKKLLQSEKSFKQALVLDKNHEQTLLNLAFIKQIKADYITGIKLVSRVLEISPDSVEAHYLMANLFKAQNNFEKAEVHFLKTLELQPQYIDCLLNYALLLKNNGKTEQAVEQIHKALAINPYQPQVYWMLADLKTYKFKNDEILFIEQMLEKVTYHRDIQTLLFAKAKYLEDNKKYKKSFDILTKANEIKFISFNRAPTDWKKLYNEIKKIFQNKYDDFNQAQISDNENIPIFIAGMPRSGSTLVEQIVATHSKVTGASELLALKNIMQDLKGGFPHGLTNLNNKQLMQLGENYLINTSKYHKETNIFTDKYHANFIYLGFILMTNPNARFIHTKRNSMDVCLSTFKQNFAQGNEYSFNLKELVDYHFFEKKMVKIWKKYFPKQIHTVKYEKVVKNPDLQIRKLLDFLNLEFELNCMNFYKTKRSINTASAAQVSQPIYKKAVKHYKKYGDSLKELKSMIKGKLNGRW